MRKISLSNIADELAAKSGLPRDVADNFMHAFVEAVEKGLQEDNMVKIKGLGTFKLQEVSDRGSVDVNTGKRITIRGHRKVTFTPESAMKELVNRPFAHFEPTELNDGYPVDDEPFTSGDLADESDEMAENIEVNTPDAAVEEVAEVHHEIFAETTPSDLPSSPEIEELVEERPADEVIAEDAAMVSEPQATATTETPEITVPVVEGGEELKVAEITEVPPVEEVKEEPVKCPEGESVEESVKESIEEPVVEPAVEPVVEPIAEPSEVSAEKSVEEIMTESVDQQTAEPTTPIAEDTATTPDPKPKAKKKHGFLWTIVLVLLLLVAVFFLRYFYFYTPEERSFDNGMDEYGEMMVNPNLEEELGMGWNDEPKVSSQLPSEKKESVKPIVDSTDALQSQTQISQSKVTPSQPEKPSEQSATTAKPASDALFCTVTITESLAVKTIKDITPADTADYRIEGTLTTHQLKSGETIIQLAKKYYGDKRLWPYIVKYNWMKDYNNVAIGQMINIPVLKDKPTE